MVYSSQVTALFASFAMVVINSKLLALITKLKTVSRHKTEICAGRF
jgi:hypothetical protein